LRAPLVRSGHAQLDPHEKTVKLAILATEKVPNCVLWISVVATHKKNGVGQIITSMPINRDALFLSIASSKRRFASSPSPRLDLVDQLLLAKTAGRG